MRSLLPRLVRLFPAEFRNQFGDDLVAQMHVDYDRARARGRVRAFGYALLVGADLMRSAAAERLRPTWAGPQAASSPEGEPRWPMNLLMQDLRHSIRTLRRAPGFVVLAVGTLGLAIGVNAGIFSVVDTVLLKPLPYDDAERLVYIAASAPGSDQVGEFPVETEFWVHYRERSRLLEDVAIYNSFTQTLRTDDRTERVRMSMPTTSLFSALRATPILGRLPLAEDEDRVAVISHALWTTWFGADSAVVGRSYYIARSMRTVIGVMGPDFRFPRDDVVLWIPANIRTEDIVPGRSDGFDRSIEGLVARMAPGATREAIVSELTTLARQLPERFGGSPSYARLIERHRPIVRPLEQELVGGVSRALWMLMGSVGIVLLIACANVTNLFMVHAERRQREFAVRRAIGAGRGQLFRSQMLEAILVAVLGGALALVLAWVSVPAILRAAPPDIPRLGDVSVSTPTLVFTLLVSVLAGLLCGLIPAVRSATPSLTRLRDGSRGSTRGRHRTRDGLVVAQTALALVLLIGSGLLMRSFRALQQVDPGYDTEDIFTFQLAPELSGPTDAPSYYARFHLDFMDRVASLPGVESVGVIEDLPLNEGTPNGRVRTEQSAGDPEGGTLVSYTYAGGDYFATMGIDVLAGRGFTSADHISALGNVIISRSAADLLWPGEDPIGKRLQRDSFSTWETVVGVVDDVMQYSFRDTPEPMVYHPLVAQPPSRWVVPSPAYVVKTRRAETIAPEVRALAREVAPQAPMYRVFTMAGLAADSMVQLSFALLTLGITSLLALILGAVGLYGVLSNIVADRRREIGVRMALGAEARRVRRMVVAQGTRVVFLGVTIGVAFAIWSTRALGGLLFGVGALDFATFLATIATMVLIGMLASYVPARRASNVDPNESLRAD